MNLINDIKIIINNYIHNYYTNYLKQNNILKIPDDELLNILKNIYETNCKELKSVIRNNLKEKYKNDYPSGSIENIILDIFQDKDLSIKKIKQEIIYNQNNNNCNISLPIYNNSLNMNINIIDNFVLINSIDREKHFDEDCNIVERYKFIYSINNIILEKLNYDEKINLIQKLTKENDTLDLQLYFLL